MTRKIAIISTVAIFVLVLFGTAPASAEVVYSGNMYYNYYSPMAMDGTVAQLYVSPRPVPAYVGHTYITYQPLAPHEFLYTHGRTYLNYDPCGGGATVTRVRYGHRPQPFMRCYPCGRGFDNLLNLGHHSF